MVPTLAVQEMDTQEDAARGYSLSNTGNKFMEAETSSALAVSVVRMAASEILSLQPSPDYKFHI